MYICLVASLKPGSLSSHLKWVARQYEVLADILASRSSSISAGAPINSAWHPAYLLHSSAEYAVKRRTLLASTEAPNGGELYATGDGIFVGQVRAKTEAGGLRQASRPS